MQACNILERLIARQCIADLLAAGFLISVNDGEETTVKASTDATVIYRAMFTTDEDYLQVSHPTGPVKNGWVRFIYGNDGWDVISDYTVNLTDVLKGCDALSDAMQTAQGCDEIAERFALDGQSITA